MFIFKTDNNLFILILLSVFLLSSSVQASTNKKTDFQIELKRADKLRSSDPTLFNKIIAELILKQQYFTKQERSYFNYLLAYQAAFQGNYTKAVELGKKVKSSIATDEIKLKAQLVAINAYAVSQDWVEALTLLSETLRMLPYVTNMEHKQLAYNVTTIVYNLLGQHNLALKYADKLKPDSNNKRRGCFKSQQTLKAKYYLNLLHTNDSTIEKGVTLCRAANEIVMAGFIQTYQISLYIKNNNIDKALSILQSQLPAIKETNYSRLITDYTSLMSDIYWLKNDIEKTNEYALLTLSIGNNIAATPSIISSLEKLYLSHQREGKHQKALEYHVKYAEADKAYLDETKAKHLAFQLAKHHEFENKTQIKMLDEQNQRLTLAKALSDKQQENNYLFIALLMTLMTMLSAWAYKSWMTQRRLKELAEYDALTGIFNRGHFVQLAQSTLKHHKKSQQEISCVLFDLDLFKQINDTYGHSVGDIVLKQAVDVCKSVGRHNDILGRLGGEEFGFILPGCSILIAEDIANKCRKLIQNIDYLALGLNHPITASFGVTDMNRSGFELENLLADADSAMYASKHHGRNAVTIYKS